jgi:hypothetical protein
LEVLASAGDARDTRRHVVQNGKRVASADWFAGGVSE